MYNQSFNQPPYLEKLFCRAHIELRSRYWYEAIFSPVNDQQWQGDPPNSWTDMQLSGNRYTLLPTLPSMNLGTPVDPQHTCSPVQ